MLRSRMGHFVSPGCFRWCRNCGCRKSFSPMLCFVVSGTRAAVEIVDTMLLRYNEQPGVDKVIPMAHYRKLNPNSTLHCSFCGREGSTVREGKLLAFKKGSRYILCHNNCAEFSPEVEVTDGKWRNVFTAFNRCKTIPCIVCGVEAGGSIGCSKEDCNHSVHYSW
jgi:hypothetical protein